VLQRYRRVWLKRHERSLHVLHWERPGVVWAMDFAEAAMLIDGIYPYLFAVRDLASGQQLLWEPVADTTAKVAIDALSGLFVSHGAPLVLKSDNGPAFRAAETKQLLQSWQVGSLFSPPGLPAYNGACEAAIGSLKRRTEGIAYRAGGMWTSVAVEAARQQANRLARPWGAHGPVREQLWNSRKQLTDAEREAFRTLVAQLECEERRLGGSPEARAPDHYDQAALDREAIRRALVAHGYLWFTRRRLPSLIKRPKVTKIM
jgi:transposase InsO family protein